MPEINAQAVWVKVIEVVKQRTIAPTLWVALEKTVGVTTEGEFFVVGFHPADYPDRGHLTRAEHTINVAIQEFTKQPLRLRMIEGTTLADWETAKKREEVAEASRLAALLRRQQEDAASKTWDGVLEQISRKYATLPMRQLPQVRAKYLAEAIEIISDGMETLYPKGGREDELAERSLARVIEKLATFVEIPPVDVATYLLRHRGELK